MSEQGKDPVIKVMSQIKADPEYIERRRRECMKALEPFSKQLVHIYSLMPHPGFKVDVFTNEMEPLPISKEWQERIDAVLKMKNEFIKFNFPELYNP